MRLKKEDIQLIAVIAIAVLLLTALSIFFYPRELRVGKAIEGCIIDQNTTSCEGIHTVITLDPFLPSIITEKINSTLSAEFSNENGFFGNKTINSIYPIGSPYLLIFPKENYLKYYVRIPDGLTVTSATLDLAGQGYYNSSEYYYGHSPGDGVELYDSYVYVGPQNISFYVGNNNSNAWQYEGDFTGVKITTPDFSEELNNYFLSTGGYEAPIVFLSKRGSVVELSNIKIMVAEKNLCQVCIAADGNCDTEWSNSNTYTVHADDVSGKCFYHWDTKQYNYSNYEVGLRIKDSSGIMSTASKHILLTTIEANTPTEFNFTSAADSNLTLFLNETLSSIIAVVSENLTSSPPNLNALKAIDVEVDDNTKTSLLWSLIKIFYDEAELTAANIDESTLKIYYYNESAAEWQLQPDQGVDTENNYVWVNVTHSSTYGVFGDSSPSSADSSSSGVFEDSPPPSSADSSSSGGGGGGGGSTSKTTTQTYTVSQEQLSIGSIKELKQNDKIEFDLLEKKHLLKLDKVTGSEITITVSSEPQQKTIVLGTETVFDLGEHDLLVRYLAHDAATKKAKIIIKELKPLSKPVSVPTEEVVTEIPETTPGEVVKEVMPKQRPVKAYLLAAAAFVLVGVAIVAFVMKRKKR